MSTVLYDYWRSSASYRVRIALHLAQIPFVSVPVNLLNADHKSPEHLARHPQGLVPALKIDGHMFTQSLAILEYLNETHGMGLLPEEPAQAARTRALAHTLAVDIHPVCNLSVVQHAAQHAADPAKATKDWMHKFIRPGLLAFEHQLSQFAQAPYACGASVSLADICLIPQLYNARRWGIDVSDLKRIQQIEQACEAHAAFTQAHPDQLRPKD